jgi:predicted PurR-regulated permease PerM
MTIPPVAPPPSHPAPIEVITPPQVRQRRALDVLALVAAAFLVRLAMSLSIGLFLGALLAFTLEPLYARLRRRQMRPGPAALICALGATLSVAGVALALASLLVVGGQSLLDTARSLLASGGGFRTFVERLAARITPAHVDVGDLATRLENQVLSLGTRIASFAAELAGLTFSIALTLLFMTMAVYFVLRNWTAIVEKAEQMLPFDRRHTHALLDQFRTVGRQVLLGTVVTGILQGIMAGIGYWIAGVQAPAFFGALTALASLIPGVGTVIVWATVGVALLLTGHVGAGLFELTYGALVVGIVADYVVRPRLVGQEKGVPAIVIFISLFGGVEAFGIIGLILGPVIASLSLAVLRTYAREVSALPPAR